MAGPDDQTFQGFISDLQSGGLSYQEAKHRYQELGDAIRRRYEREITALAVDVVRSHSAKSEQDVLDTQLIFDGYHRWVEEHLAAHGCPASFTWSGDGLLAVFDQPEPAVAAGRALLADLPGFNARHRQIGVPLQVRIGVHSGPILAGDAAGLGKVASRTFDLAGHLQKAAAPNQMLISETTYTLLHEGGGQFVPVRLSLPNPGACFAYPPESTTLMPVAPDDRTLSHTLPPPARSASTVIPWVLAAAGLAASLGVLVTAVVLWPRASAIGGHGSGQPAVSYQNTPLPLEPAAAQSNSPAAPANAPAPAAGNVPSGMQSARGNAPPALPSGAEALLTTPARIQWKSPDAQSGIPPRLVPSPPESKWLLAIGVGRYRDRSFVREGAAQDARTAAVALAQSAAIPTDHVRVLTDEQATLESIRRAMVWLQQSATSGKDTIFVYLSGAALMAADRRDLHHPGGSGYAFLPYDASPSQLPETAVYGSDLADWLGAAAAQTEVVIADTSHSVALDVPILPDPGRQFGLLASSGETQQSSAARGPQGSPFLTALLTGLRGAADQDHDQRISLNELQQYLKTEGARMSGGAESPDARPGFGGYLPELFLTPLK